MRPKVIFSTFYSEAFFKHPRSSLKHISDHLQPHLPSHSNNFCDFRCQKWPTWKIEKISENQNRDLSNLEVNTCKCGLFKLSKHVFRVFRWYWNNLKILPFFLKKPRNFGCIFSSFSVFIFTKYKFFSKIELWSKLFKKLEIYVLNSSGIVLYAPETNSAWFYKFLKIDKISDFFMIFLWKFLVFSFFNNL